MRRDLGVSVRYILELFVVVDELEAALLAGLHGRRGERDECETDDEEAERREHLTRLVPGDAQQDDEQRRRNQVEDGREVVQDNNTYAQVDAQQVEADQMVAMEDVPFVRVAAFR